MIPCTPEIKLREGVPALASQSGSIALYSVNSQTWSLDLIRREDIGWHSLAASSLSSQKTWGKGCVKGVSLCRNKEKMRSTTYLNSATIMGDSQVLLNRITSVRHNKLYICRSAVCFAVWQLTESHWFIWTTYTLYSEINCLTSRILPHPCPCHLNLC